MEETLYSLSKVALIVKKSCIFTIIIQEEKKSENFLQPITLNSTLQISLTVRGAFNLHHKICIHSHKCYSFYSIDFK